MTASVRTPETGDRTCKGCGITQSITLFDRRGKYKRRWHCRACWQEIQRQGGYNRAYRERNAERERERHRALNRTPKGRAREAARRAVQAGKIIKAEACESCGTTAPLNGHHDDYEKPLEVRWLCRPCHEALHRQLRRVA